MNFDFYHQFRDYSNIDLLKIVQQPDDYQPEALAAAEKILNERTVSANEIESVHNYYKGIEENIQLKAAMLNAYKAEVIDLFQPVVDPGKEWSPAKWLKIFLVIIGLQYAWTLYLNIRQLIRFMQHVLDCTRYGTIGPGSKIPGFFTCFAGSFDIFVTIALFMLVFIAVIAYLLYKRKRWGWILLFGDTLIGFIAVLNQSYFFFKYLPIHHENPSVFLLEILVKALLVIFLWRKSMTDFFGVSKETKNKTAFVSTLIAIALMFGLKYF